MSTQGPNNIEDEVVSEHSHPANPDFTEQPTMTLWRRVMLRPAVPGIPTPPEVIDPPTATNAGFHLTDDLMRRGLLLLAVAALVLGGLGYSLGYLTAHSAPSASATPHAGNARITTTPTARARATATPTGGTWQMIWQTHGMGDTTVTPPTATFSAAPRFRLVWICSNSAGSSTTTTYLQVTVMQGDKPFPIAFVLCPGYGNVTLTTGANTADTTDATLNAGPFSVHMQAPSDATWTVSVEVPRPS